MEVGENMNLVAVAFKNQAFSSGRALDTSIHMKSGFACLCPVMEQAMDVL